MAQTLKAKIFSGVSKTLVEREVNTFLSGPSINITTILQSEAMAYNGTGKVADFTITIFYYEGSR